MALSTSFPSPEETESAVASREKTQAQRQLDRPVIPERDIEAEKRIAAMAQERTRRLRLEEEPILRDLRTVGIEVRSIWDLVSRSTPYPEAIPVLLKHLRLPYSDRTRSGIARSLAVPEPMVREALPFLVEEYRKAPMGKGIIAPGDTEELRLEAKSGLALAVAAATTETDIDEFVTLARDRSLGSSRLLLLRRLKRSKSEVAKKALEDLATDPDLEKEIASWRKRSRS